MKIQLSIVFLFLLLFISSTKLNAQHKLDSLLLQLNKYKKEDTVKLNLLNAIGQLYRGVKPDNGIEIAEKAVKLGQELNDASGLSMAYWVKGINYYSKAQFPLSIEAFQKSLDIAEKSANKSMIAKSYLGLGTTNSAAANFPDALDYFKKALNIYTELGDQPMLGTLYGNLGNLYKAKEDFPTSLKYYQQALDINEKQGLKENMAANLGNMGLVYHFTGNNQKALEYQKKALAINEEIANRNNMANNLGNIGLIYLNQSEFQKAIDYFQQASVIKEQIGNKQEAAYILGDIGTCYANMSDYPKALEYYQQTLNISNEIGDKYSITNCLSCMGNIYNSLGDQNKAIEYFNKAMELSKETEDKGNLAVNLINLGTVYHALSENSKSLEYLLQGYKIRQELGIEDGLTPRNIGDAYLALNDYDKALDYFNKSLLITKKNGEKQAMAGSLTGIGSIYLNMTDEQLAKATGMAAVDRYSKGIDYLNQGLDTAVKYGLLEEQKNALEDLSNAYEQQKDYGKSMETYKKFIIVRDSAVNDIKKKQITRLEIQYEYNKKADSLKAQQQLTDASLKQQTLLAQQRQQQLALNQKELALTNKEKDLQKLAYLKTQSDLQNEQLEKQKDDKQLTIAQKEKELQKSQVKDLSQQQALSKLKLQQQWTYSIGILVLLGLLASYFIYRNRLKEGRLTMELAKEKAEQEKKEAEFQRSLADVSLTALRSQMNPHFIFNCLNSIKLYTTQNDTTAAVEYLTKFSKLIRLVMENSRNDRISLSSELQALRLYIEMEAMRFKEKLKYSISVDNNVEADYIEIPPLLLQPYVENAIWHGLMHKEEGGKIDINVAIKTAESLLEINIIDDGIGRARSAELKSKTATLHKSYGMKVTSERIALINQIYKAGANVTIHDVTGADGKPNGTRVTIQIPV